MTMRLVYTVLSAFLCLGILCACAKGPSSQETSSDESSLAGSAQTEQTSTSSSDAQSGSGSEGTTQQASDSRAEDFAVDPARTDWNYEAPATKTVYLTFDDGPSENTQPVLDILDRYGIKATFFVTGMHPDYFPMIAKCYAAGHTIGMHTYSHEYDQVYASVDAYWNDLNQISDVVREQIGYVPCFIRFPGGSSNTISANYTKGIMTELAQEVQDAGYQYYDWDASCGDGAEHTADELVNATMADTSYGYKSVVFLMHDGVAKETTVEALPRIIEYFQSEGYEFAAIDRNTCVPHHGIGN